MKKILLFLIVALSNIATADTGKQTTVNDWRKTGSDQQKLENVVKVIPGASNVMLQMGERYKNLHSAGRQGKWEFAEYQVEEIQSLIKTLMITRPKRAATAKDFLDDGFKYFPQAIEKKSKKLFSKAFKHMRDQCMICHSKNDHAFIVLPTRPRKGNSPVLD